MWDAWSNIVYIYMTAALALIWAFLNAMSIKSIDIDNDSDDEEM